MILQYHLTHGHTRNALLDPLKQKIYFLPKEIETLEEVIAEYTEYPAADYRPISLDHFYHAWLELLEVDLNFDLLEDVFQFASDCLCSYLMIRVHKQQDLERLAKVVAERKAAGLFSLHQLYLVTTFEADLNPIPPDPNHFFKIKRLESIEADRRIHEKGFTVLQNVIIQAHHSNLFYDLRLFLDQTGFLKPRPGSSYEGAPLSKFQSNPGLMQQDAELTRLWSVTKEQIKGCQVCEFRHVCVDPSDLHLQEDGQYARVTPCDYDPLQGTWATTEINQPEPSPLG